MSARKYWSFAAAVATVIGWNSPSAAYVNQIVIDQTNTASYNPIPLGSSVPGSSVTYTIYTGRIFGVLDASNPLNSVITDLNLAAPVQSGTSYIAQFSILTPTNPAARSGLLIHEVPNRGGNAINTNALVAGATYVQSGWQGDLLSQCSGATGSLPASSYPCVSLTSPYGSPSASYPFFTAPTGLAAFVIQVPVATTDGNAPNGSNIITGQVYGHVCIGNDGCGLAVGTTTSTAQPQIQGSAFVPYQPASSDTNQASLWTVPSQTFTGVEGTKTPIPSAQWAWAYCPNGWPGTPNPDWICLNGATFNPNDLYELVYTAANPLVLGVGFAAFRDLDSFLRYGTTAPGSGSNPIAGSVTRSMVVGASQSAAFIHGLIFYGFNEDESGRIVFDGAWPEIDGRMMVMNIRWGQPNNLMYLYMGGDEAPVWWADYPNMARNLPADGMLHRCNATNTCPQILETFGSAELYSEKMSASLCGFTCVADIPLPSNVYRYFTPGATHGGGTVSFTWTSPGTISAPTGQLLPNDPIPEAYTNNALQYALIQLLMNGTAMPPSVYPTLAKGELVVNTAAAEGFPTIPALPFGGNQAWPPFVYDFGPGENYDQESGIPTTQPPNIQQVLPVYATKVNADGNEDVTGLPTVLGQAPLGTYTGWNLATTGWYGPNASNGPGSVGQVLAGAGNSGGFWPFWDTKANRQSAGDPRLSLEERYGTHPGYDCIVRQAAYGAVEQRYLLASDATTLISDAVASNMLGAPFAPTTADTSVANTFCGRDSHDFDGDGRSDVLWRDTSGDVAMWLMSGGQFSSGAMLSSVPTTWSIVGTRDFTGNGNADILWLDNTGNLGIWLMNGTAVSSYSSLGNVGPQWAVVGTGDFNGDGVGDILWRNSSTGDLAIWLMNNGQLSSGIDLGVISSDWSVVGVGDFNGDGVSDILWRDNSGNLAIWFMSNGQVSSGVVVGQVSTAWSIAGTGDFNGDGVSDILWRDGAGDLAIWLMNSSGQMMSGTTFPSIPTSWSVAETGDFDGNGKSDVLWINTDGDVGVWLINGLSVSSAIGLGNVGTSWQVQGKNAD